ncbi:MAG: nitrile hydratase subunit beta [Rhizobiaceae bacterium]
MNGPHDMGGMQCYGPVEPERKEPVFHHDWERKALALTVAMGATSNWNIDTSRHARERLAPVQYLSSSYYQIWTAALEELLVKRGLVSEEELKTGRSAGEGISLANVPDGKRIKAALGERHPYERPSTGQTLFQVGDAVRTVKMIPAGHTRLPGYARGKAGVIERVAGCHVFPDSNAHGMGEDPKWLYTVGFDAGELFGGGGDHVVMIDCWEPYLERR